jgi:hypothetical protein
MAFCDLNVVRSSKERDKNAIVLRLIERMLSAPFQLSYSVWLMVYDLVLLILLCVVGWSGLAWNFVSSGKLHNSVSMYLRLC